MSGDTTISDQERINFTDRTDRNLITDIFQAFDHISGKKRVKHQRKKLREELVREHIEISNGIADP